jgi:DNA ligase 1
VNFHPMLAADLAKVDNDFSALHYPLLASPKLDGVRCIVWEGVAYSRNAKPFRNKFVQAWARARGLHNLDGEFIVGEPVGGEVLGRSMAVTAIEGEPDFTFHLFDSPQRERAEFAHNTRWLEVIARSEPRMQWVPHVQASSVNQLMTLEEHWLKLGYEGFMTRAPLGPYKHGRSTLREEWLVKVKRFMDGEAVVTGLEEAETNTNEATKDELGRTKRSSAKAGKVGNGMVGTILAHSKEWGPLRIAPGKLTHAERVSYWNSYQGAGPGYDLIGKTIHWRSFGYGVKDLPRFPRFYGIREDV